MAKSKLDGYVCEGILLFFFFIFWNHSMIPQLQHFQVQVLAIWDGVTIIKAYNVSGKNISIVPDS